MKKKKTINSKMFYFLPGSMNYWIKAQVCHEFCTEKMLQRLFPGHFTILTDSDTSCWHIALCPITYTY